MAKQSRSGALFGLAVVLVTAIGLQAVRMQNAERGDVTSAARPMGVATKIPDVLSGWTATDEPLGSTELLASEVARTLNYDDYVYRNYQKGGAIFSVYVAYWSPGRMPMEKVASHTPDRCWSENGWRCVDMRFPEVIASPSGPLKPAYWRIFVPPSGGTKQYVLYWHLVGDELYDYGGGFNQRPHPLKWWRDMIHYALLGSREQYFIRLTCDRPFESLASDPGFQEILQALGRLGLAARAPAPSARS